MLAFAQMPAVRHAAVGALGGLLVAIRADSESFRAWKCWADVGHFDWSIASFRYIKGAVIGALTFAGFGAMVG